METAHNTPKSSGHARIRAVMRITPIFLMLLLIGCDNLKQTSKASQPQVKDPMPFMMQAAGAEMFLLDSRTGKVWHYESTQKAFLEVPVTSEIIEYERGPDGKLRRKPNNTQDPLGLLEKK